MKNNTIGIKIKELRIEKGLSQRELGEKLGFSNQTISFWESGKREPSLDYVKQLADFFKVSADFLLGMSEFWLNRIIYAPPLFYKRDNKHFV